MKIILTTYPNKPKELKKFIMILLGSKLTNCISKINYIKSYYFWEWKLERNEEKLLLIKINDDNLEKPKKLIEKKHPYKIPEIIVLNPIEVNESYLNWIN